jgi:peptide/nickel transport system substrate-binding protein
MRTQPRGRVTRWLAPLFSVLVVGALLAACGGGSHGTSSGASNASATSSSGSAVVNWAADIDLVNWDPVVDGSNSSTQLLSTIYEPLFTLDSQGVPQPALATGWKYNATGTQITITLRPGLTFQDGSPINAQAVAYNIQRIQTQANSALKADYQDVASATVLNDLQVRLNLKQTDYQIPYILSNRSGLLASEKAAEANPAALNSSAPVGAGPFKVVKFVPETSVTLVKWPGYWDAKDIHVDRINLTLNVDAATVLSGLQTGVYNFANYFPAQDIAGAKQAGLNVVSDTARAWSVNFISFNTNKAPFNNPKVLQALQYAFNRQQFVDELTFGTGVVTQNPFPSTSPGFDPSINNLYSYDPNKTKQLLAAAGYKPGSISVTIVGEQGQYNAESEIIQQQFRAVGIKATIDLQTASQYITDYYGKKDTVALYGYVGRDSKLEALDELYGDNGVANLSSPYVSPEYTAAREKVLKTPIDSPDYNATLQAATKAGVENGSNILLWAQTQVYVTTKAFSSFAAIDGSLRWNGVTISGK